MASDNQGLLKRLKITSEVLGTGKFAISAAFAATRVAFSPRFLHDIAAPIARKRMGDVAWMMSSRGARAKRPSCLRTQHPDFLLCFPDLLLHAIIIKSY
jgi:hypothetical protein